MKLEEYKQKRNFSKTPEPQDKADIEKLHHPIYLIQKHDASRLHYDFRLEIDGILKSWAIPKGPSRDPKVKRLAVETEDHPLAYASFSGKIPVGEYGAGTVVIWDRGTFKNIKTKSISAQYKDGQIEFQIRGRKLKGPYVLIKTGGKNWIFKRMQEKTDK